VHFLGNLEQPNELARAVEITESCRELPLSVILAASPKDVGYAEKESVGFPVGEGPFKLRLR